MKAFGIDITLPDHCPYCESGELKTSFIQGLKIPVRCDECSKEGSLTHSDPLKRGDIQYNDGGGTKYISKAKLKHIKSHVTTHEGEHLSGQRARKYMDNHSKNYLGKDLSGSYNRDTI